MTLWKERSLHLLLLPCFGFVSFSCCCHATTLPFHSPHQHAPQRQHSFIRRFHYHLDFVFTMGVHPQFPSYPSMERQDLSQGQLGSFKFAPVDAGQVCNSSQFLSDLARQYMSSHLKQAARNPAITPVTRSTTSQARIKQVDPEKRQNTSQSHVPTGPISESSFFNDHIRPDLEDSRLKYGPAVVRSAVNSNSPEKKRYMEHFKVDVSEVPAQLS